MIEYPYLYRKNRLYPIIPVTISKGQMFLRTEGLIDSGANISVFSADIAEYFGIDITKGEKVYLQGIGGHIAGYIHEMALTMSNVTVPCRIVLSPELIIGFNVLGRENLFDKFLITFDESHKKVRLMPI